MKLIGQESKEVIVVRTDSVWRLVLKVAVVIVLITFAFIVVNALLGSSSHPYH